MAWIWSRPRTICEPHAGSGRHSGFWGWREQGKGWPPSGTAAPLSPISPPLLRGASHKRAGKGAPFVPKALGWMEKSLGLWQQKEQVPGYIPRALPVAGLGAPPYSGSGINGGGQEGTSDPSSAAEPGLAPLLRT